MFIEFTFTPKLLFILIYPIFKIPEHFIGEVYLKKDNNLFKIFRTFLSKEFSFIFLLIFKCINKSSKRESILDENEKIDENNSIKLVDIEIQTISKKNKFKSMIFLFLLTILYVGSYFFNYYARSPNIIFCRNSIGIIYRIILFYILSLFILKESYYKHHYLSIALILLLLILLTIIYLIQFENSKVSKDSEPTIYNAFWFYLVYYVLYGLFDILLKKYFLVYIYSIYLVILIIGAFACVPMLIYDIIAFFINKNASGIIIGFVNNVNNAKNVFLFIVDLLLLFISNFGIFWTIYYFTPFHLIICEFITELINYYIGLIQFKPNETGEKNIFDLVFKKINIIIFSVVFFINLICSLIFNEIIILKFCKLEYYTQKYIKDRAKTDVNISLVEHYSDNSENESSNINDN